VGSDEPTRSAPYVDDRDRTWADPPKTGRVDGLSESFDRIWALWLRGQTLTPDMIRATERARAYRLIYKHLTNGTARASEVFEATRNYLDRFNSGRETFGCKRPPAFYRLQDPCFLEFVTETTPTGAPLITLDAFNGSERFALQCARQAALRLKVERPEFSDGDGWAEFLQLDAEIQRVAVQFATS